MTSALQKSECCSATSAAQHSENCSAAFVFACGMLQGWGLEGWGLGLADSPSLLSPAVRSLRQSLGETLAPSGSPSLPQAVLRSLKQSRPWWKSTFQLRLLTSPLLLQAVLCSSTFFGHFVAIFRTFCRHSPKDPWLGRPRICPLQP